MKFYELTYLLPSEFSEEELKSFQEKIISFIQEEQGILGEPSKPAKRRLVYQIKKTDPAYLISVNFQLNPENLKNLEKKVNSENQILRYTIIKKGITRPRRILKRKPLIYKKTPQTKVELKEIEEKLDEILKE